MTDFCILVTGQSNFVDYVKKSFKAFSNNILFSCWEGDEQKYNNHDTVVFNSIPDDSGFGNINLQKIATLNGLYAAKDLGYDRVLKIRSDLVPTNDVLFMQLINNTHLNLLSWTNHSVGVSGYFVDYMMAGSIDLLVDVWSNLNIRSHSVSEVMLTKQLIRHSDKINYILQDLSSDNDLMWLKYGIAISTYKNHTLSYINNYNYEEITNDYVKII